MNEIASKNSPSNRARPTELYVLNSITTIAIVSQLSQYYYRNSTACLKRPGLNYRNSQNLLNSQY